MTITYKNSSQTALSPDEILEILLAGRGVEDSADFYNPVPPSEIDFASFFDAATYSKQIESVLSLLKRLKTEDKAIIVYSDYDADGITGGAILWQTLSSLGFRVFPYIPDRKKEGYGFSTQGIDQLIQTYDPGLIISVDHGIVGHLQIAYAQAKGIPVIVTDHHMKSATDPDALAVFHTSKLSGSGVAYFFARELARRLGASARCLRLFETDFLVLAAIGTVADMVPLQGASRSIAHYGLGAFQNISSVGLREMSRALRLTGKSLKAYDIGFLIAPRINAFGRLTTGMDALRLLCTHSQERAKNLMSEAEKVNTLRQRLVEQAMETAEGQVDPQSKIIIVKDDDWEEGIVGLIAGKLVQRYGRPAIAFTKAEGDAYKASVRSIGSIHILDFLKGIDHEYLAMGGHAGAAGLSIKESDLLDFEQKVGIHADSMLTEDVFESKREVDLQLPLPSYTLDLADALSRFEPFGMANPEPVFATSVRILDKKTMGKTGKHVKYVVGSDDGGALEMVHFNSGPQTATIDEYVTMIFRLGVNEWNDRRKPQGIVDYVERSL